MKFLTNLDLSQNEIQNAVIQPLAAAPANPKLGQIYYNSSDSLLYQYDGVQWKPVGKGYELPAATKTALGGIKVGDRLSVAADGTLSADKQTDNNLTAALKANYDAAYQHSQASHAPADAEKNVQSDWNVTDSTSDAFIKNKPAIPSQASDVGAIPASQKGAAGGVAELDSSGHVPADQLPSYVDDVIDAYIVSGATAFSSGWLSASDGGAALTPESGKVYIILTAGQYEAQTYRWSGTVYAPIGNDLALGETENTAYRGDRGKVAYEHSQAQHAPADAEKNVQADWNVEDTNSDAYIQHKPTIPKAVTKTVKTMTAATTATYTVSGYIVSVVLIDSVTKEQIMGDLSFDNATASANSKVTVTFSAAPTNPVLVIITSIAL